MSTGLIRSWQNAAQGGSHRWWALAAVECGNFVVYMDSFIVTLALPTMARRFDVDLHLLKWVVIAYVLTVTVTLMPAGRLADIWGRRCVMIAGMAVLLVSSLLCAFAGSIETLIGWRVLQGVGGGLVLANVMAEITSVFPKAERRKAMSINASVLAFAQITGLMLGGLLIDHFGWRSLFFIMVAVCLVGLAMCWLALKPGKTAEKTTRFDWPGAVLAVLMVGVPFLFIERHSGSFLTSNSLGLLMIGLLVLGLFVVVERHAANPFMDLNLFRSRGFVCGCASASLYFVAAASCYFLLPLYTQIVLGLSPVMAGVLMVPLSVALTATSLMVGRIGGRVEARLLSTAGMLCVSGALLGLSFTGPQAPYFLIVGCLILLGVGGGLFHPPNNSSTLGHLPPKNLGVGNGFLATSRNFGQAIGAAIAATLLAKGLGDIGAQEALSGPTGTRLDGPHLKTFLNSQSFAFRLAASMGLIGAVISWLRGGRRQVANG